MNEDVAYIITDAERTAFKDSRPTKSASMFIEQFWLRRDPTPDTSKNEFKEEHYRRIAYANQHFASKSVPGWKTDRGRIYITYGPPDEIESHPSGGRYEKPAAEGGGTTSTFPFEQWRYRYIEGVGNNVIIEFVDPTMTGEYRMTMDPAEKDALRFVAPPSGPAAKAGATVQTDGKRRGVARGSIEQLWKPHGERDLPGHVHDGPARGEFRGCRPGTGAFLYQVRLASRRHLSIGSHAQRRRHRRGGQGRHELRSEIAIK